jgi:hypothetical protein
MAANPAILARKAGHPENDTAARKPQNTNHIAIWRISAPAAG